MELGLLDKFERLRHLCLDISGDSRVVFRK
jgi:hypothetical protein